MTATVRDVGGRTRISALVACGLGTAAVLVAALGVAPGALATGTAEAGPVVDQPATATAQAERLPGPPAIRQLTVLMSGEVLNENPVNDAGARYAPPGARYDFAPVFAPVAPIVAAADLAVCHAEIPLGRPGEPPGNFGRSLNGGNLLRGPYEVAAGLAATGFDRCSTASNHAYDRGQPGVISTIDALSAAGISAAGTARTPAEAADISRAVITVAGVRVAHLAYTRHHNTAAPPEWAVHWARSPAQVAADVAAVRAAGAELVIVSLHTRKEMLTAPLPTDRQFAIDLLALTHIDLLAHHGAHVVQPMEWIGTTPVYWSLGNFVSGMGRPGATGRAADLRTLDGLLARVRFREVAPGMFVADPQHVLVCNERAARTVRAPVPMLADAAQAGALPVWLRAELQACIDRTSPVVPDAI